MSTVEPPDFDAILAQDEERARNARLTARFAPLWAEADAAIRSDVGLVVELAKAAGAAARGEPLPPVPRAPHDDDADERTARRREADRRRWHARKADKAAVVDEN